MPDVFSICPPEETLCFTRGDTVVWERIIVDGDGAVTDISGFGYVLTVDSLEDPTDSATNIFSISGSIPTGTDGRVLFQFSAANWTAFTAAMGEPPVSAFYDLLQTDLAGNDRTVRKGEFQVEQDINK